jgi:hypothetical protein
MKTLPCFQHVHWDPDRDELRRFAMAMLIGFGALGALSTLRHGGLSRASALLWIVGCLLAASALIRPLARATYLAVYLPTSMLGWMVSHILLTLVFYGPFTVIGTVMKLTGTDSLMLRKPASGSAWRLIQKPDSPDHYYRQY